MHDIQLTVAMPFLVYLVDSIDALLCLLNDFLSISILAQCSFPMQTPLTSNSKFSALH